MIDGELHRLERKESTCGQNGHGFSDFTLQSHRVTFRIIPTLQVRSEGCPSSYPGGPYVSVCSRRITGFVKLFFAEPHGDGGLVALRDAAPGTMSAPPRHPYRTRSSAPLRSFQMSLHRHPAPAAPSAAARASAQPRATLGPHRRVHLRAVLPQLRRQRVRRRSLGRPASCRHCRPVHGRPHRRERQEREWTSSSLSRLREGTDMAALPPLHVSSDRAS